MDTVQTVADRGPPCLSNVSRVTAVSNSVHVLPCLYANTCLLYSAIPRNVDFNQTACVRKFCFKLQKKVQRFSRFCNKNLVMKLRVKPGRTSGTENSSMVEHRSKMIHVRGGFHPQLTTIPLGEFELSFIQIDD